MALRIREIVKLAPPLPRSAVTTNISGAAVSFPPLTAFLRGPVTRPPETSEALYAALLAAYQGCLDDAQHEQRLTLGAIPTLIAELVQRLGRLDPDLLRLSLTEEQTGSLAHHGLNVAILAIQVGIERGLYEPQVIELGMAALLHDVGMVKVTRLTQTPSTLSPEARAQVRQHPVWSGQLLKTCRELPAPVHQAIAQEHERVDGSGYPHRLKGAAIHEHAQLVGLLDVYESLTHDRPHRPRLMPSEAMRTMIDESGSAFRTELLRAFLRAIPMFPVESWIQLNTGELAKVIATTRRMPLAPTVTILVNPRGRPRARPETVDLATERRLAIVKAVPEPKVT